MPIYHIDDRLEFPPVEFTDSTGILGVGGDLSVDRLLLAYKNGIFPWYDPDDPIMWWSPDPRFILYPEDLHISKSTRPLLRKQRFQVTFNRDFPKVIRNCKEIYRPGQRGTWISDELEAAYIELHERGIAHSVEVWEGNQLVGGLYGEMLGQVFFGESMFSLVSNASKVGFITWVRNLHREGVKLIDSQVHSNYLEGMGARHIPRPQFLKHLQEWTEAPLSLARLRKNFTQDADFLIKPNF